MTMGGPDTALHADPDYFPATLGVRERWSTISAVVFSVIVLSVAGIAGVMETGDVRWMFLSLPFMLIIFVLGRLAPRGYRLAPDGIRIERRVGSAVIPYRRIRDVDRQPRPLVGLSIFATRGVFGRFGTFWNPRLGFYRLYVTDRDAVVWLATDRGWVGLSPDRPDEFVRRLEARRS
jgi:hypothetical protein